MDADRFAAQIAGVAALDEPVRRDLYLFVSRQPDPVTRDDAAAGVGVPRHTAKFHLDRLVEDGLLDVDFKRLTGREGPGAGRPTKHYRRTDREFSVALPERRYALAGEIMATAIEASAASGTSVTTALHDAASDQGNQLAQRWAQVRAEDAGQSSDGGPDWAATMRVLAEFGYEPRITDEGITMVNCPFHSIAQSHVELVCGMNLALLESAVAGSGDATFEARLMPAEGRCCVVLTPRTP